MIAALVSSTVLLRYEMPAGRIPPASAPLLRGLHRFQGTVWGSLVFQFGERANYEAHFGSVGSRYLLHFYMSYTGSARARSNSRRRTRTRPCSSSNFPDRWSAAECIEHIAAAEDYIRGMIIEKVMAAPAAPNRDVAKIDAGIIANVPEP